MQLALSSRDKLLLFCLLTLGLVSASASTIPTYFGKLNSEHLWLTHLTLELLSIFVSVSIVAILFQRLDKTHSRFTNTVIFSFSAIALLDFIHALSYQGMPVFVTESSTAKAIFFWLSARSLEVIAMFAIAFRVKLPGTKLVWLFAAIGLVAIVA
ncbi:MASE3 domain-containing protein [Alishewanella longhuensis]